MKYTENFLRCVMCFLFLIVVSSISCSKFLDVGDPVDKVSSEYVYKENASAISVLTGIYNDLQKDAGFCQGEISLSLFGGVSSDELNAVPLSPFYGYYVNEDNYDFWSVIYSFIYRVNTAIEGVVKSKSLSLDIKNRVLGEAMFVRAFCYFYLVNLYGDVPLVLTSNYKINSQMPRFSERDVYKQIVSDLKEAVGLLENDYLDADLKTVTDERIRPNKWSALALLSRASLYAQDWRQAIDASTLIINNKSLFELLPLKNVFNKNSREAIWQLQPNNNGVFVNTRDAVLYILSEGRPDPSLKPVWLSYNLIHAFEENDARKEQWVGEYLDSSDDQSYFYPYKYKSYLPEDPSKEYLTVFRVAEQYLIRSEALLEIGQIPAAMTDLNIIRQRAGLPNVISNSKEELLNAVLRERRIELFTEWGHRWFDLKRTGKIDDIMDTVSLLKGGVWHPYKKLYPIPVREIRYNVNLIQNDGYPSN